MLCRIDFVLHNSDEVESDTVEFTLEKSFDHQLSLWTIKHEEPFSIECITIHTITALEDVPEYDVCAGDVIWKYDEDTSFIKAFEEHHANEALGIVPRKDNNDQNDEEDE